MLKSGEDTGKESKILDPNHKVAENLPEKGEEVPFGKKLVTNTSGNSSDDEEDKPVMIKKKTMAKYGVTDIGEHSVTDPSLASLESLDDQHPDKVDFRNLSAIHKLEREKRHLQLEEDFYAIAFVSYLKTSEEKYSMTRPKQA